MLKYFNITFILILLSSNFAFAHDFIRDDNIYTNPNFTLNLIETIEKSDDLNHCVKDILLAEKIYTSIKNGVTIEEFLKKILHEVDEEAKLARVTNKKHIYDQRERSARHIYGDLYNSETDSFRNSTNINKYSASQFVTCLRGRKIIIFADRIVN